MAQVPYSPVPTARPSGEGQPALRVPANISAAFGENIARAMEGAGRDVSQAGNELFSRAIALQELTNTADARQRTTDLMLKQGEMVEDFKSKQGKNAFEAYPQLQEGLRQTREDGRPTNPDAARKYDSETQGIMASNIRSGAAYAGEQHKKYLNDTITSKLKANRDAALANPNDEIAFNEKVKESVGLISEQSNIHGWSDDTTKQEIAEERSALWFQRISGKLKSEPDEAKRMLGEAIKREDIRGGDVPKITDMVNHALETVGARNISHEVNRDQAVAGVPGSFINQMKRFEGYRDKPYWDYKQWTSGYGTKAAGPHETVSRGELNRRFESEVGKAAAVVDKVNPALSPGTRAALTSLTYNTGEDWTKGALGAAIRAGDEDKARELFLQYNRAGGKVLPALVDRRQAEVGWFGKSKGADETLTSKISRGRARAEEQAPNDIEYADATEDRIIVDFNKKKAIARDERYDRRDVVDKAFDPANGPVPFTLEEYRAKGPEYEAAYDNGDEHEKARVRRTLKAASRADWFDPEQSDATRRKLVGMSQQEPDKFLDADLWDRNKYPLNNTDRNAIRSLREKVRGNPEGNPQLTRADNVMKQVWHDQMDALGILNSKQDPDAHAHYMGTLLDAINVFQDAHGRQATYKDIKDEIGPQVIQQRIVPEGKRTGYEKLTAAFGGTPQRPGFEPDIPDSWTEQRKKEIEAAGESPPTDEELRRAWNRQQFTKLWGAKKKREYED